VGRGAGRTDFEWKWNLRTVSDDDSSASEEPWGPSPQWELSTADFAPYSHVLPKGWGLFTIFNEGQYTGFRELLGGLYIVPLDQRLPLVFQAYELQRQS
jgi:hypothetical protein